MSSSEVKPFTSSISAPGAGEQPEDSMRRPRVLCVDDSPKLADVLARLIKCEPDLESVGTLNSAEGIVDEVIQRRTNVVVMDLSMPGPDPMSAIRELTDRVPACTVVAYSGYDHAEIKDQARRAGAVEVVGKGREPSELLQAIRRAASTAATRGQAAIGGI